MSDRHFNLKVDYLSSRSAMIRTFGFLIGIFMAITILIDMYIGLDILNTSLLAIAYSLSLIEIFLEKNDNLRNKQTQLKEFERLLKKRQLHKIIDANNKFIKQADWYVAYAGNILKKQKEEATEIDIFECDINQGVLKVKDWENPISEYQRRISELAKK
jgi:hypothetical protein